MRTIAIVAGGPASLIPELNTFEDVQVWIGVDRGAYVIKQNQLPLTYALGDFDSITDEMYDDIIQTSQKIKKYRPEKNESDLELAVELALTMKPDLIYIFGATGGRLDHALINLQLLEIITKHRVRGVIIDQQNQVELYRAGIYPIAKDTAFPYYSFIPYSAEVKQLTLKHFTYSLSDYDLKKGSTRCISNELMGLEGEISFIEGLLYVVKSKD